ncbi:MAG: hypothetical protein Q9211_004963 [Gyalolechia sp. 1 TL-2023]
MTSENHPLVVAQTESRRAVINAAVTEALNTRAPDSSQMRPGRVYVGRLAGHSQPVFVRRRRKSFRNPFGVPSVTSIWAQPAASPMDHQYATTIVCQPQPPPSVIVAQPPAYAAPTQVVQPPPYLQLPPQPPVGTTTTTITTHQDLQPQRAPAKHTCAACGKFRSARYHYRHPLASGETPRPTLCRKCIKQHTSSEEFDQIERARWKKRGRQARQQQHHPSYSSDEWSSSSGHEERRRRHRYRSFSETRRHRRIPRSSSGVNTRVYIIRQPEERQPARSSSDSVRIVRRVRTSEDRPRHRYGPFDGHRSYEDYYSDEHVEADIFEHRGRSRSRSLSRNSIDGSHSIEEDYVRVSTSIPRRRWGLLDRLSRSRSRSSSRSRSRWRRDRSDHVEDESLRISIRSREPSPLRYDRYEHEYEERTPSPSRFPWRLGSDSVLVQRGTTTLETHSDDFFDRPRYEGRSYGLRHPTRSVRIVRARSPSILRRRSLDHGMRNHRRKVFSKNVVSATSDHRRLQLYAMSLVGVVSLTPLTATKTSLGPCSTAVIFRRRSNPTRIPGVGATPENTATLSTGVTRTNPAEGSVWWMFKAYEIGMEHLKGRAV